jgi:hypothetical protein
MNVTWGLLIVVIGVLFVMWGRGQSDFVVYRLLAARSRILWGGRVHGFYQVVGLVLVVVGLLVAVLG